MNFFYLFFYLIFLLFLYYHAFGVGRIVILLYAVMIFSSIILSLVSNDGFIYENDFIQIVSYFICMTSLLIPFVVLKFRAPSMITVYSPMIMKFIDFIVISLSLFSVVYFSSVVIKLIGYDDLESFRHLLVQDGHPFIKKSFFNTLSGVVATFYLIPLFLFFLSVIRGDSLFKRGLLLFSSFSYPLFVLSSFGRDGVLFWSFSFVCFYLYFDKLLDNNFKRIAKKIGAIFIILFVLIFLFITSARFIGLYDSLLSILTYIGMQPKIAVSYIGLYVEPLYGAFSFPLFYSFFGYDHEQKILDLIGILGNNEYLAWSFGTIVLNFIVDFGLALSFIIISFSSFLVILYFKVRMLKFNFISMLLFLSYTQIVMQGVFYFRQYNNAGNFYLLILFALFIVSFVFRPRYTLSSGSGL